MASDPSTPTRSSDSRRGLVYPSPFFDIAQTYLPPTIKELFKYCSYFFYTDPLLGAVVYKIAEYPVTDFIYNDEDRHVREKWEDVIENVLNLKPFLIEIGLDYFTFGNAFISINFPFKRLLECPECKHSVDIYDLKHKFKKWAFHYECPKCKSQVIGKIKDIPLKNLQDINFIRWDPKNIEIEFNPLSGKSRYRYKIPSKIKKAILAGKPEVVNEIPWIFIQAVKKSKDIILSEKNLFHFKRPTLAEQDQGWGKPLILHSMKRLFYLYVLRRAQEAIALQRILPLEFIFPQPNASQDPYTHTNLGTWGTHINGEIAKWKTDPNHIAVIPVPLGFERLGGDGRALLLGPEIDITNKEVTGGMGVPLEFVFGGLCIAANTLTFTSKGAISINTLAPSNSGSGNIDITTANHNGLAQASRFHDIGVKKAVRITTRDGYTLEAAKTHPLLILKKDLLLDFRKIQDLTIGDYVVQKLGSNLWSQEPYCFDKELDFLKKNHVAFPETMSLELGRLLGYIASERCVDKTRVRFGNKDRNLVDDYCELFRTLFNRDPRIYKTVDFYNVEVCSVDIAEFFDRIGAAKSCYKVTIPNCVLQSPKEVIIEFLKGYYEGDGTVCIKPNGTGTVSVSSKSAEMLQQIQLILQNIGIESTFYGETKASPISKLTIRKTLSLFEQTIGFISKRKQLALKSIIPDHPDHVKIPYVKQVVMDLKKKHPIPRWTYRKFTPELILSHATYNATSAARALGRKDKGFILSAISDNKLKATVRGKTISITSKDLVDFCEQHGVPEHIKGGWPRFYKKFASLNAIRSSDLSAIEKYAPETRKHIARIVEGDLRFDEITDIEDMDKLIPMSDLSVPGSECYIAGGLICHNSWSGSSVSLRTLENHFLMYRRLLLRFLDFVKKRLVLHMGLPDIDIQFTEFKMADDVQRKQLVVQLNAAQKVSTKTLLTELGFDYDKEQEIIRQEIDESMKLQERQMRAQAKAQGEAQIESIQYQSKAREKQQEADIEFNRMYGPTPEQQAQMQQQGQQPQQGQGQQQQAQTPVEQQQQPMQQPTTGQVDTEMGLQAGQEGQQQAQGQDTAQGKVIDFDPDKIAKQWATRILKLDQATQNSILADLQRRMPHMYQIVLKYMQQTSAGETSGEAQERQKPLPEARPPRRENSPV